MKKLSLLLVVMLVLTAFASCKDENPGDNLDDIQSAINNSDVDYDTRLNNSENFVENFLEYLKTEESFSLSPDEIADKYDSVHNVSFANSTDNNTYRIYWVSGDASIYGTLEKEWTFIQWKDGGTIHAKEVESKSGKKAQSAVINGNKIAILGYDNMYSNKYIYISLYEISGENVNDITPNDGLENEKFIFSNEDNDTYISSILYKDIYFENIGTGFKISDDDNEVTVSFDGNLSIN